MNPKVFISYSWKSQSHCDMVRQWADRLLSDGVEVILDQYDLQEGQDKHVFMERMVTDASVTHVLVVSEQTYAEKADARKSGVGTEAQIMSREIYEKVDQQKFIPIVCEFTPAGDPCLPAFMKSRMYLDFASLEQGNDNWERLIRLLFGKSMNEKPAVGKPPAYLQNDDRQPTISAIGRFAAFRQAYLQGKRGIDLYRNDFLQAAFEYADSLRTRERPDKDHALGIVTTCDRLVPIRNLFVDWMLLEGNSGACEDFDEALIAELERLLVLKSRPEEVKSWSEDWFDAHVVFGYEVFLYIVASLVKNRAFRTLNRVFTARYMLPETEPSRDGLTTFKAFLGFSQTLNVALTGDKDRRYRAPVAELIKRQANRQDIRFDAIMEADLLCTLMAAIQENVRWYPQTLFYARRSKPFPFFLRACQHRHFVNLGIITGMKTGDELRAKVKSEFVGDGASRWREITFFGDISFWEGMNMEKLDSIP